MNIHGQGVTATVDLRLSKERGESFKKCFHTYILVKKLPPTHTHPPHTTLCTLMQEIGQHLSHPYSALPAHIQPTHTQEGMEKGRKNGGRAISLFQLGFFAFIK